MAGTRQDWLEEIEAEREHQDAKWGGPEHDDSHWSLDWVTYIREHADKAVLAFGNGDMDAYRQRMIEVAALAVAAIESLDRKLTSRT